MIKKARWGQVDFIINKKTKEQNFKGLGTLGRAAAGFPIMGIILRMNLNQTWKVVIHVLHVVQCSSVFN